MPQETKNIIQLKESTSGPNFYPETHKAAIVGKEDYTYLGQVVSPGGGGGGSTGGDKPLSVSPRQSVIVGKAIPFHPRKGKKYYFADGVIKVKTGKDLNEQTNGGKHSLISYYDPNDLSNPIIQNRIPLPHDLPNSVYSDRHARSVLVTIMQESPGDTAFDLSTMVKISFTKNLTTMTESPFIDVIDGKVIVNEIKVPTKSTGLIHALAEVFKRGYPMSYRFITRVSCGQILGFSGHIIAYNVLRRKQNSRHDGTLPNCSYRRNWLAQNIKYRRFNMIDLLYQSRIDKKKRVNDGETRVFAVRRGRIGKNYYPVHTSGIKLCEGIGDAPTLYSNVFKESYSRVR